MRDAGHRFPHVNLPPQHNGRQPRRRAVGLGEGRLHRARRLLDKQQTGELIRGAFGLSQEPQPEPERGGAKGELPEKQRDQNMCR